MKKFIYTFSVLATLLTLSSCKKYLDINTSPNAATAVDPKLLFSYASVAYINLRSSGDMYIPIGLASQSISAGGNNPTGWSGGDPSADIYTFSSTNYNNSWVSLYVRAGANLQQAIKLSESASPVNNNAAAQCRVLLAMAIYDVTTTFGDVPYTEAWNPDVLYPHFDPQKTVLEGTLTILDKALAQFDESSPLKIGANADGYDLFYKGDIAKWKRLAKSLKLRTLLTMVDADATKQAAIAALVNDGTTSFVGSAADNCLIPYQDVAGKRNPKYAISLQYNNGLNFFFATKPVTDIMDPAIGGPAISDPRLPKFFDKPAAQTKYIGVVPGADAVDAINPRIAASLHSAAAPEVMFTYQEQLFNEAEIYARGLGVPVNLATATARFRSGIEASCLYFGVPAAAATAYANQFNTVFSSQAVAIQAIHAQQWVDKMDRGLDAFTQWRRSGIDGSEVPVLTLPIGAPAGPIFRRFEYPITNELSRNPNAPATIKYNVKMWFDL